MKISCKSQANTQANISQISDKSEANLRQISGKFAANPMQISCNLKVNSPMWNVWSRVTTQEEDVKSD